MSRYFESLVVEKCSLHRVTRVDNYDVWKTLKSAVVTLFVKGEKISYKCWEPNALEARVKTVG